MGAKLNIQDFRLMADVSPVALILVDNSGVITYLNEYAAKLFGYDSNELLGEKMELLVPDKLKMHHPNLRKSFYKEPKARPMGAGRDLFGVRKDGIEIPLEIGLNPIEKDGKHFVLASIIDITERKKHEEAANLYAKKIEAKNRELEQFAYIVSHDLREPLTSITGLIELLIKNENLKLDEEVVKILNLISMSSARMMELIRGLLDYARLGKNSETKKSDFNKIADSVIIDLDSAIKSSNAKIQVGKLPVLNVYEFEIWSLFQNIIGNALKYKKPDVDPEISISAKRVDIGWEFNISDNGIGIPPEQKDKIFEIFQRLHARDEYEGVGIGLAHCKKIVELHNGKIWVESAPEKGSSFYFFIPGE